MAGLRHLDCAQVALLARRNVAPWSRDALEGGLGHAGKIEAELTGPARPNRMPIDVAGCIQPPPQFTDLLANDFQGGTDDPIPYARGRRQLSGVRQYQCLARRSAAHRDASAPSAVIGCRRGT